MKDLADKVAVVTGAASGIGQGIATALAQAGVRVMLVDIEKAALDKAVETLKRTNADVDGVIADVSVKSALEDAAAKTIERFGKVHIVVNNAGVTGEGPILASTQQGWEWVLGVNLWSVIYGFQIFSPLIMKHGEGGHIVSTASIAGMIAGGGAAQYNVSKFGVVALSEASRVELAAHNIGVSVLCPGFIRTNILDAARNLPGRFAGAHTRDFANMPANDPATPLVEMMRQRIAQGIDPLYVGELVREAIEANELYIFTDNEFEPAIEARAAEIKKAFDRIRARKPRH